MDFVCRDLFKKFRSPFGKIAPLAANSEDLHFVILNFNNAQFVRGPVIF